MVRLPEGDALEDEVVGYVGREHVGRQRGLHLVAVDREGADDARGDRQAVRDGPDAVEEGLDGFLEVLVVGGGETLEGGEEASCLFSVSMRRGDTYKGYAKVSRKVSRYVERT